MFTIAVIPEDLKTTQALCTRLQWDRALTSPSGALCADCPATSWRWVRVRGQPRMYSSWRDTFTVVNWRCNVKDKWQLDLSLSYRTCSCVLATISSCICSPFAAASRMEGEQRDVWRSTTSPHVAGNCYASLFKNPPSLVCLWLHVICS